MVQPKISFGVQGRDVKQGEELQPSWIWRDVEVGRVGMGEPEGPKANRPQDPARTFANDFHCNPGQFTNSMCIGYLHLTLLMVHLPLPLLWTACTPTHHTQSVHNN